jgi:hypothetical protein
MLLACKPNSSDIAARYKRLSGRSLYKQDAENMRANFVIVLTDSRRHGGQHKQAYKQCGMPCHRLSIHTESHARTHTHRHISCTSQVYIFTSQSYNRFTICGNQFRHIRLNHHHQTYQNSRITKENLRYKTYTFVMSSRSLARSK